MKHYYIKIFLLGIASFSSTLTFAEEVFSSQTIVHNKQKVTSSKKSTKYISPERYTSFQTNSMLFNNITETAKLSPSQHSNNWPTNTKVMPENLSAEINMGSSKVKANSNGVRDNTAYAYARQPNLIPPTATAQITLAPEEKVRPYLGLGVNYTEIYDETGLLPKNMANKTPYQQGVLGSALQFGADVDLSDSIYLNLDAKKLNMRSATQVEGVDQDIDQWVYALGLGVRF